MSRRGGFYEALGVATDASPDTIREAYRERVKEVHPDRSDDPDAGEQFKRVTRAKEVLTDPDERARYDRLGHEAYVGSDFPTEPRHDVGEPAGTNSGTTRDQDERRRSGGRTHRSQETHRTDRTDRTDRTHRTREDTDGRDGDSGPGRGPGTSTGRGPGRERPGSGSAGRSTGRDPGGRSAGSTSEPDGERPGGRRADGGAAAAGNHRTRERARGRRQRSRRERGESHWRGHGSGTTGTAAGPTGHAAERYDGDWYTSGASSDAGYDVSPGGETGLGPERVGLAAVAFVLYPLLAAGAFTPWFPPAINAGIGLLGLVLVVVLLWTPESGVLAFGAWTVLAPAILVASGVGIFSLAGVLAWSACWIPFLLSVLGLVFRHP